jgi:hypothetical protein
VVGIWYNELKTKLLKSYKMSLDICKELGLKVNITHKHCSKTKIIPALSNMMVRSKQPSTRNVAMLLGAQG